MVPQQPFDDLRVANEAAATWCTKVNAVTHSELCAVPTSRLVAERPRPDRPDRAPQARTQTEKDFLALGPVAEAFLVGAAAAGVSRLSTELADIATLQAAHGSDAFAGRTAPPMSAPSWPPPGRRPPRGRPGRRWC
jgi:hypothetical protein